MIDQSQWVSHLRTLLPVPLFFILLLVVLYFAFLHLEQIDVLIGRLYALFALLSSRFRKSATAKGIEASINRRAETVEAEVQDLLPHPMRIEWIQSGEEFATKRDGEIIVVIRDRLDDSRNMIAAIQSYLHRGFLFDSRPYIAPSLLKSIDLVMAWKLLGAFPESSNTHAYYDILYNPSVESNPELASRIDRLIRLDDSGVFTRILLREFRGLGRKLRRTLSRSDQHIETEEFAEFLDVIERADPGTHYPLNFIGKNIRASVQLVARIETVAESGLRIHRKWLKKKVEMGAETIYIRGIGAHNVSLARNLAQWGHLQFITETVRSQVYTVTTPRGRVLDAILITCHSRYVSTDAVLDPEEEVHAALVRHVDEIAQGQVEVVDIARDVGVQSKVLVRATRPGKNFDDYDFDRLRRNIHAVVADMHESVWLIPWTDDQIDLITHILGVSGDEISDIDIDSQARKAHVIVRDEVVAARAVGTKGTNVRLCQQLTGFQVQVSTHGNSNSPNAGQRTMVSPEESLGKILLEEVPGLSSGDLRVIDSIREPGVQSMIIVDSADGRNPVPRCLGPDREYLDALVARLGERVWFVPWCAEQEELLMRCLGIRYRNLVDINIQSGTNIATVRVSDRTTAAMAIGENGINTKQAVSLLKLRRINVVPIERGDNEGT